ncbi:MAG: 2-phospho-L-lactate guanylyltransferase [Acidimicrobiales bacterium]|nr:2-phospho-L-lactate guanylyltransferase [Acidimicrobiales bacterium]
MSATACVVIPVKDFAQAKLRLAPELGPSERDALARRMASAVVAAAGELPVAVVCDAESVRAWADVEDVRVIWTPGLGLNGAVRAGVDQLGGEGYRTAIVAHSDIPLARELAWVGATPGVTLVPDRALDGTNVLAVPTDVGFRFAYGSGSFTAHRHEAERLGQQLRIVKDARLSWDVDLPADLALPAHP